MKRMFGAAFLAAATLWSGANAAEPPPVLGPPIGIRLGEELKTELPAVDPYMPKPTQCYRIQGVKGRLVEVFFRSNASNAVLFDNGDCAGKTGWQISYDGPRTPLRPTTDQLSVVVTAGAARTPVLLQVLELPTEVAAGRPLAAMTSSSDLRTRGGEYYDCYVLDAAAGQDLEATASSPDGVFPSFHAGEACEGPELGTWTNGQNARTARFKVPTAGRYSLQALSYSRARYQLALNARAQLLGDAIAPVGSAADALAAIAKGDCARGLETLKARSRRFREGDTPRLLGELAEKGTCVPRDLAEARRLYVEAAERGDREAAYRAGRFLLEGTGGPADATAARRWLQRAEDTRDARYYLAVLQRDGVGGPQDLKAAISSFDSMTSAGYPAAARAYGEMRLAGQGWEADRPLGFRLLGEAALAGDAEARAELLKFAQAGEAQARYRYGAVLASDPASAAAGREMLRQAYSAGVTDAGLALAAALAQGSRDDKAEAARLYDEVAVKAPKLKHLARYLRADATSGTRAPASGRKAKDCKETYRWELVQAAYARWGLTARDACQDREVQAEAARADRRLQALMLGKLAGDPLADGLLSAELGRRCEGSREIAPAACGAWYDAMSWPGVVLLSNNSTLKSFNLGAGESGGFRRPLEVAEIFHPGRGQVPDADVALGFYQFSLWSGQPDQTKAQANQRLYELYSGGIGVPKDAAKAGEYLRQAAFYGGPEAMYKEALDALAAAKTREDRHYAGQRLRAPANAGVVDAAYRYAKMVERGETSSKQGLADIGVYYEKAANAGHVGAMTGMGKTYENGWGRPADVAKAEAWYVKAARAGDPEAAWRLAVIYSQRGDHPGSIPWLKIAAKGGWPKAADTLARLQAQGIRERTLGNMLLSGLELVGEVATRATEQIAEAQRLQQEQLDAEIAWSMRVNAAIHSEQTGAPNPFETASRRPSSDSSSSSSSSSSNSSSSGGTGVTITGGSDGRTATVPYGERVYHYCYIAKAPYGDPVYFSEAFGAKRGTYAVGIQNDFNEYVTSKYEHSTIAGANCMGPYPTLGDAQAELKDHIAERRRAGKRLVITLWTWGGE